MSKALLAWHAEQVDSQQAYYDVFWIMQYCLGITWTDLHIRYLSDYAEDRAQLLQQLVLEYKKGKPLPYIVKNIEFYGLPFYIEEGVLIPRADTEYMVSEVIGRLSGGDRVLELGVGSGVIACSIAKYRPDVEIMAIDASDKACEISAKNVSDLGLGDRISICKADWYDLDVEGFDWVVANPPYIASTDEYIEPQVRAYEPKSALFSGNDGCQDLLYIIQKSKIWLKKGGRIALEHGFKQQDQIQQALMKEGYGDIYLGMDKVHPRFIMAKVSK